MKQNNKIEAAIFKKKKQAINKGKLKRTIKSVLCRPDPVSWPVFPDEKQENVKEILQKHKIDIPEFKKPKWSELKNITKAERPKRPTLKKIDGLIFGINECCSSIKTNKCKAVILDADLKPQMLVHHIIESCQLTNIPFGCLQGLKEECKANFGITTCCLGITDDSNLSELRVAVKKFSETTPKLQNEVEIKETITANIDSDKELENKEKLPPFEYLYRTSKTSRVFVPPTSSGDIEIKDFSGQNVIRLPKEKNIQKVTHLKNAIVKRMINNPNRKGRKKE